MAKKRRTGRGGRQAGLSITASSFAIACSARTSAASTASPNAASSSQSASVSAAPRPRGCGGGGATAIKIAASIDSAKKSADTSSAADSFFGTFWDVFFWDFFGLF